MPADMQVLQIDEDFVPLFVALQLAGWVDSGGQAKFVISQGEVCVNSAVETQKRKKLRPKDVVSFDGQNLLIESS
jgi:ribosome-associated protein